MLCTAIWEKLIDTPLMKEWGTQWGKEIWSWTKCGSWTCVMHCWMLVEATLNSYPGVSGNSPESYECCMQIAIKMLCMWQWVVIGYSSNVLDPQPKEKLLELLTYKTLCVIRDWCPGQERWRRPCLSLPL
jgi:hypothetical protein